MAKELLKLKISRENDIDSLLRTLTDNDYKVWRTKEFTEKVGSVDVHSYFVVAERGVNSPTLTQ